MVEPLFLVPKKLLPNLIESNNLTILRKYLLSDEFPLPIINDIMYQPIRTNIFHA